jgi:hypothetical protein
MKKYVSISLQSLAAASVVALSLMSAPAQAEIFIGIAPPEPRVEMVPQARLGYVWAPGYWAWRGHHHVWSDGHWVRARAGYRWTPDRWDNDGGRWRYFQGHWERN